MFNNREIATAIWLILFAFWAFSKPAIRKSLFHLLHTFVHSKILAIVFSMLLYTAAVIALLSTVELWQVSMLKDTVIWFCLSGFIMVVDFVSSKNDAPVFKQILLDNIKVLIVIEFIINTYTFPLIAELAFVPFVAVLVIMDAFAKTDAKYDSIARLTGALMPTIGLLVFSYAIWSAVADIRNFGSMETLLSVAFPPLMSILFTPFVYCLVLVTIYENIFLRLKIGPVKTQGVIRYTKRRTFSRHGLKLGSLREFSKRYALDLTCIQTTEDVDRIFSSS